MPSQPLSALARAAALALVLVLPPAAATAAPDGATRTATTIATGDDPGGEDWSARVVDRADAALAPASAGGAGPDATLALRDVFTARRSLSLLDGVRASDLLARPTDGRRDAYGDGYRTKSHRTCDRHLCVHSVRTGPDAPPSQAWVKKVLAVVQRVWKVEIGKLGYDAPPSDGGRGGDGRFDVYLKDLGAQGLFGYCAPERRTSPGAGTATSYCVLDDDFARSQFGAAPLDSLRVTAAHEFFHAVQFGYDVTEDPWLLESTAMWMEDQVADGVNDNRDYLKYGQLRHPDRPLDTFASDGYDQYGNWAFWAYLSEHYGAGIVHRLWNRLAATPGAPDRVSVGGLREVLAPHGGLGNVYVRFAAALDDPAAGFDEGSHWPPGRRANRVELSRAASSAGTHVRLDHLTSRSISVVPDDGLRVGSRLRLSVDGPPAVTAPRAVAVVVTADGKRRLRPIRLDDAGRGSITLPFDPRGPHGVVSVVLTLANTSTRYECHRGNAQYACRGNPLDENQRFDATASVVG